MVFCAAKLQTLYDTDPVYNLRMGDLVTMLMPMLRLKNTNFTHVPAPSENMLGFTQSPKGRYAFRQCLQECCKDHRLGDQTKAILQKCQTLRIFDRMSEKEMLVFHPDVQTMDGLHDEHDKAKKWAGDHSEAVEMYIISLHIRFGIFRENGETNISASQNPDYDSEVKGYFAEWPKMLEAVLSTQDSVDSHLKEWDLPPQFKTTEALERLYFDAWVTLLFRACCWGACHDFVPGERVPSEWWESQFPIYIG